MDTRRPVITRRVVTRRVVFCGVLVLQAFFVVRAYWAPHNELGFQMFPDVSEWQAEVVRVTADGKRIPVEQPWDGYVWHTLVTERGLGYPDHRQHANNGLASQLAFLEDAMTWVGEHTPHDHETLYYEATVTTWDNMRAPTTRVMRSPNRDAS